MYVCMYVCVCMCVCVCVCVCARSVRQKYKTHIAINSFLFSQPLVNIPFYGILQNLKS